MQAGHASAVLAFERDNRAFFAASISDRGNAFFAEFAVRHRDLLAEQDAGVCAFYVLIDEAGEVVGRFNLYDLTDGRADVGYRVAQRIAGRGVATAAVLELCGVARTMGLRTLFAVTSHANVASQKVLTNAGFEPVGAAHPSELGGKHGTRFRLHLSTPMNG